MANNTIILQGTHFYNLVLGTCWASGLPSGQDSTGTHYAIVSERLWMTNLLLGKKAVMTKFAIVEKISMDERREVKSFITRRAMSLPGGDQISIHNSNQYHGLFPCQPTDTYLMAFNESKVTRHEPEHSLLRFRPIQEEIRGSIDQILEHNGFMIWAYRTAAGTPPRLYCNFDIHQRYGIEHFTKPSSAHQNISEACFKAGFLAVRLRPTDTTRGATVIIVLTDRASSAPLSKTNSSNPRHIPCQGVGTSASARGHIPCQGVGTSASARGHIPCQGVGTSASARGHIPLDSSFLKIYHLPTVKNLACLEYDSVSSSIFYHEEELAIYIHDLRAFVSVKSMMGLKKKCAKKMIDRRDTYYAFFTGNCYLDTRGLIFESHPDFFRGRIIWARDGKLALNGDYVPVRSTISLVVFFPDAILQKNQSKKRQHQLYYHYQDVYGTPRKILKCRLRPALFSIELLDEDQVRIHGYTNETSNETTEECDNPLSSQLGHNSSRIVYKASHDQVSNPLAFFMDIIKDYLVVTRDDFFPPELWMVPSDDVSRYASFTMMSAALSQFQASFMEPLEQSQANRFKSSPTFLSDNFLSEAIYYGHLFRIFLRQYGSPLPFRMPLTFFSHYLETFDYGTLDPDLIEYFSVRWQTELSPEKPEQWMKLLTETILMALDISRVHPVDLDYYLSGSY